MDVMGFSSEDRAKRKRGAKSNRAKSKSFDQSVKDAAQVDFAASSGTKPMERSTPGPMETGSKASKSFSSEWDAVSGAMAKEKQSVPTGTALGSDPAVEENRKMQMAADKASGVTFSDKSKAANRMNKIKDAASAKLRGTI